MIYVEWLALVLAGYLLGGIPVGLIVGRISRGIDIRQYGSGMVGATNTLRTLGWGPSAVVFLADIAKAFAAVQLARLLGAPTWVLVLAGVAAVAGHCWSPYIKLGGGRGVSCSLGATLALGPLAALAGIVIAGAVMARSRYVSLGSLTGTAVGLLTLLVLAALGQLPPDVALMTIAAVIVFYRHRDNIERLQAGTERKLGEKARPVKPPKGLPKSQRSGSIL